MYEAVNVCCVDRRGKREGGETGGGGWRESNHLLAGSETMTTDATRAVHNIYLPLAAIHKELCGTDESKLWGMELWGGREIDRGVECIPRSSMVADPAIVRKGKRPLHEA